MELKYTGFTAKVLRESAERVYKRTPEQSKNAARWFHNRVLAAAEKVGNKKLAAEVRAVLARMDSCAS